jgi:transposase
MLETRRRKIIAFLKRNLSLHEIARRIGCHASSVLRWRNAFQSRGPEGLKAKPASGRPPKLSAQQKQWLVGLLAQGAVAHGYRTELWTPQRIADLIAQRLGVRYHRNHVGKLLHRVGWSHPKPERRALERDAAGIETWKQTVWPRVKKRRAAGSPPRLSRRKRLPPDPVGAEDLEPGGTDAGGAASVRS